MKKLIILGAGASFDFGFPTGMELCKKIHSAWNSPADKCIDFMTYSFKKYNKKYSATS